jgi:membrane associated rhomboid family serine protease
MNARKTKELALRGLGQMVLLVLLAGFLYLAAASPFFIPEDIPWLATGVAPREARGLLGIFIAPVHHEGYGHLFQNLIPLLALAWGILLEGTTRFWKATALIVIGSGLLIWLFGSGRHLYLGSSALVFGYMGFMMMRAYVTRRPLWIALALMAVIIFGGRVFSIALGRGDPGWLGHFSGFVAGMWAAAQMHRPKSALDGF